MKGAKLITVVLIGIVLVLTVIMVALNLYPSWSQYARSLHEPLLFGALTSISSVFLIRSFTHKKRLRTLFKVFGIEVRLEHLNRATGFFFIGVLCTPVTHPSAWIESAHLVFTFLGIGAAHLELWFYHKGVRKWSAIGGSIIGVAGFLGAFVFHLYTIGMGELIAAIPIIFQVMATNKQL